jgi:hypothetical protein
LTVLNGFRFENDLHGQRAAAEARQLHRNVRAMVRSRYRNATGDRNQMS